MTRIIRLTAHILFAVSLLPAIALSQLRESVYSYTEAFDPHFYTTNGNEYRSASGKPGPKYWQNAVDYKISAHLNEQTHEITAKLTMEYINNSPDELDFLWLQLDQNMFSRDSRGQQIVPLTNSRYGDSMSGFDGGYDIKMVTFNNGNAAEYIITDTRMQVFLAKPLRPQGDRITIHIEYSYIVPEHGADRTSVLETQNGKIFAIAQWFPRMVVYDDIQGWNTLPYTGPGEFYLEYGDYEIDITVQADHMVVMGAELLNPDEVYTPEQLARLEHARNSDTTVMVRSAEDASRQSANRRNAAERTWRFKLENSRDIAWASSPAFIIDAARINLSEERTALAISAYPIESYGGNAWERSTEYTKAAVEFYSDLLFEYPYPVAVNVAAAVNGMEYPAIAFCNYRSKGADLWGVTDHEFGHIWFPMIVGTNERLHAWMDEGFNMFLNELSTAAFNNGEYYRPQGDANRMAQALTNPALEPVMSAPQNMAERSIGALVYYKPGFGMTLLRNEILGPERFDRALRSFIHHWAYKHPTPYDFFRTMENVAGENLNWFWRGWFKHNWRLDQAVRAVVYPDNNPENGALITIDNLEKMPMPVILEVTTVSGTSERIRLPVEIWARNTTWTIRYPSTERIKSVQVDPDRVFPDHNPENNRWESP